MNPVKRVLGHIYFGYAILMFIVTMVFIYVPVYITTLMKEPRKSEALHNIFRIWMGIYMPLIFCPVFRKGKHYFAPGQNYVVICNHNSLLDIPVSSPWIPGANKTLAKIEMAKTPVFGMIYKAGSILVDRSTARSRAESFVQMKKALEEGLHLCLYPEGTRNKTEEPLQPFFDGAFVAAVKSQKPIIPAVIFNTGKVMPHQHNFWASPHFIRIHFLEPVATAGMKSEDINTLKEKMHTVMENYYVANR